MDCIAPCGCWRRYDHAHINKTDKIMQDVLKTMESPTFIVCTILVGLVLNVISSYLREGIDRAAGGVLQQWSSARFRRNEQSRELIFRLGSDRTFNRFFRAHNELNKLICFSFGGITVMLILMYFTFLLKELPANGPTPPNIHTLKNVSLALFGFSFFMTYTMYARYNWRNVVLIFAERVAEIMDDVESELDKTESATLSAEQR
jgi:hypothetical protein